MKQVIIDTAMKLMVKNGTTTTLEVKNEIHANSMDPNFDLRQNEVSQAMSEMFTESNGDIDRIHDNGHYVYSLTSNIVVNAGTLSNANALVVDSSTSDLFKDNYVAFDCNNTKNVYLFNTKNRYEARNGFKLLESSVKHDDIRMRTLKSYENKYGIIYQ